MEDPWCYRSQEAIWGNCIFRKSLPNLICLVTALPIFGNPTYRDAHSSISFSRRSPAIFGKSLQHYDIALNEHQKEAAPVSQGSTIFWRNRFLLCFFNLKMPISRSGSHILRWGSKIQGPMDDEKLHAKISFLGNDYHIWYVLSQPHPNLEFPLQTRPICSISFFGRSPAIFGKSLWCYDIALSPMHLTQLKPAL